MELTRMVERPVIAIKAEGVQGVRIVIHCIADSRGLTFWLEGLGCPS